MKKARQRLPAILLLLFLHSTRVPCLGIQEVPDSSSVPSVWTVDPNPVLSIGAVEGADEYILFATRDASQLSDGTVVVGLSMRNLLEIRYYDPQGVFLTSVGRFGDGPFESRVGLMSIERFGDSILIVGIDQRYSLWDPVGAPVRSGRMSIPQPSFPWGLLDNQHLGVLGYFRGSARPGEISESPLIPFYVVDLANDTASLVVKIPAQRSALAEDGLFLHLPFEPRAIAAAGGGYFWVGNSAEREIRGFPADGIRPAQVVLAWDHRSVSREDQRRWKEHDLLGQSAEVQRGYRAHHRGLTFPPVFPLYQDLQVDMDGRLWVLRYEPPWSTEDFHWAVFEPDGTLIATALIPFGVLNPSVRREGGQDFGPLLEIGDDYVLVRHQDGLGVQSVRKYQLIKEGQPQPRGRESSDLEF
jgi:hypothetical protein